MAAQYKEGDLILLIRPVLPSEQIKSSSKLTKAYLRAQSMLDVYKSVHPDLLGPPVSSTAPTPKGKDKQAKTDKTPKATKGSPLEHMTKPALLLGKKKPSE